MSTPLREDRRYSHSPLLSSGRSRLIKNRYCVSDISSPSSKKFNNYAPGPLLTPTNYNTSLSTYIDCKSPGLAGRIVQYSDNTINKTELFVSHQAKYGSPGVFPIVHLQKKDLPIRKLPRDTVTVRLIATPDSPSYSLNSSGLSNDSNTPDVSTSNVLKALRAISKKRILSEDITPPQNHHKRQRNDCHIEIPENNVDLNSLTNANNENVSNKSKDEIPCVVDAVAASLTSSNASLVNSRNMLKRKINKTLLETASPQSPKQILIEVETQTENLRTNSVTQTVEEETNTQEISLARVTTAVSSIPINTGTNVYENTLKDRLSPKLLSSKEEKSLLLLPPETSKHKTVTFSLSDSNPDKSAVKVVTTLPPISIPVSTDEIPPTNSVPLNSSALLTNMPVFSNITELPSTLVLTPTFSQANVTLPFSAPTSDMVITTTPTSSILPFNTPKLDPGTIASSDMPQLIASSLFTPAKSVLPTSLGLPKLSDTSLFASGTSVSGMQTPYTFTMNTMSNHENDMLVNSSISSSIPSLEPKFNTSSNFTHSTLEPFTSISVTSSEVHGDNRPATVTASTPFGSSITTASIPFRSTATTSTGFGSTTTATVIPFGSVTTPMVTPFSSVATATVTPFGSATTTTGTPFGSVATATTTPFGSTMTATPFGSVTTVASIPFGSSSISEQKSFINGRSETASTTVALSHTEQNPSNDKPGVMLGFKNSSGKPGGFKFEFGSASSGTVSTKTKVEPTFSFAIPKLTTNLTFGDNTKVTSAVSSSSIFSTGIETKSPQGTGTGFSLSKNLVSVSDTKSIFGSPSTTTFPTDTKMFEFDTKKEVAVQGFHPVVQGPVNPNMFKFGSNANTTTNAAAFTAPGSSNSVHTLNQSNTFKFGQTPNTTVTSAFAIPLSINSVPMLSETSAFKFGPTVTSSASAFPAPVSGNSVQASNISNTFKFGAPVTTAPSIFNMPTQGVSSEPNTFKFGSSVFNTSATIKDTKVPPSEPTSFKFAPVTTVSAFTAPVFNSVQSSSELNAFKFGSLPPSTTASVFNNTTFNTSGQTQNEQSIFKLSGVSATTTAATMFNAPAFNFTAHPNTSVSKSTPLSFPTTTASFSTFGSFDSKPTNPFNSSGFGDTKSTTPFGTNPSFTSEMKPATVFGTSNQNQNVFGAFNNSNNNNQTPFGTVAPALQTAPNQTFQFGTSISNPQTNVFTFGANNESAKPASSNMSTGVFSFGASSTNNTFGSTSTPFGAPTVASNNFGIQGPSVPNFGAPNQGTPTAMFNIGTGSSTPKPRTQLKGRRRT